MCNFSQKTKKQKKGSRLRGLHLEYLHKHFSGDPSVQHRQELERSEHISQLDLDIR